MTLISNCLPVIFYYTLCEVLEAAQSHLLICSAYFSTMMLKRNKTAVNMFNFTEEKIRCVFYDI